MGGEMKRYMLELIAKNQMAIMMGLIVTIAPYEGTPESNRETLNTLRERIGVMDALFKGGKDA